MTKKNQFWRGMLIGAIAGGALSLLDKQTRQVMKESVQKTSSKVAYVLCNPGTITDKVKETASKIKTAAQQVTEDISYITNKVDELRELTPQVTEILKETKAGFSISEEKQLLQEVSGEEENNN
ncbi:YtxH domain-containing protein [Neobacillus sp.]|uniref:YtxH domain-containing protein n=1 Tax=Neobacillus sp. TaxID=2675273 RepID=UPI00289E6947|nr:YtxH domain-containing protein [Neobacillus sp.]